MKTAILIGCSAYESNDRFSPGRDERFVLLVGHGCSHFLGRQLMLGDRDRMFLDLLCESRPSDDATVKFSISNVERLILNASPIHAPILPVGGKGKSITLSISPRAYEPCREGLQELGGFARVAERCWDFITHTWSLPGLPTQQEKHDGHDDSARYLWASECAERFGARIYLDDFDDPPACAIRTSRSTSIHLNRNLHPDEKASAILHELGHMALHHESNATLSFDSFPTKYERRRFEIRESAASAFATCCYHICDGLTTLWSELSLTLLADKHLEASESLDSADDATQRQGKRQEQVSSVSPCVKTRVDRLRHYPLDVESIARPPPSCIVTEDAKS